MKSIYRATDARARNLTEAAKKMLNLGASRAALYLAIGITGALSSPMAYANSIIGTLNLAGTITVSNANGGTINFIPLSGNSGPTFVVIPSTGSFSNLNLDQGTESTSLSGTAEPLNTPLTTPITGFLSVPSAPPGPLSFDLTEVLGASTVGETPCTTMTTSGSCYVAGTPFNFNSGAGGASATFSVLGNLNYNGLTANSVILEYSATFVNESIADVLNQFLTTGTSMQSSDAEVTANITSPTPEPGTLTMLLAGFGFMGIAAVGTRKRKLSR